jgi:hypothetical protein
MRTVRVGRGLLTIFDTGTALVDVGDGPVRVADWRAGYEELTGHSIDQGTAGPGRAWRGDAWPGVSWLGREHHNQ